MEMIENDIILGVYEVDDLIISTTQISELYSVNPTTAVKVVSKLAEEDALYKKRGIGMCVAEGALGKITKQRREILLNATIDTVLKEATILDFTIDDFITLLPEKQERNILSPRKNWAGKTTLMKLFAEYKSTTEGQITVDGKDVSPSHMPGSVNFIESGSPQFNMRVSELIGTAYKLQEGFDQKFALEMVNRFGLSLKKKYRALSFRMKTMLTTRLTLANNSKIILLDEPVLGFDAIMREQFNSLLLESYSNKPRIIIVSTHLIDEIAKIAEQLIH